MSRWNDDRDRKIAFDVGFSFIDGLDIKEKDRLKTAFSDGFDHAYYIALHDLFAKLTHKPLTDRFSTVAVHRLEQGIDLLRSVKGESDRDYFNFGGSVGHLFAVVEFGLSEPAFAEQLATISREVGDLVRTYLDLFDTIGFAIRKPLAELITKLAAEKNHGGKVHLKHYQYLLFLVALCEGDAQKRWGHPRRRIERRKRP